MTRASSRRFGERPDLSVPRAPSLRMGAHYDPDAFGRFSEALARFLGTGRFLVAQTFLVGAWIVLNTVGLVNHWDPYPFILLNLAFSTQAAYAARTQADTEFLARELSAVRLALADVVTTEDLDESLVRLAKMVADGQLRPNGPAEQNPAASADRVTSAGAPPGSNHRAGTPPSSHQQGEADGPGGRPELAGI